MISKAFMKGNAVKLHNTLNQCIIKQNLKQKPRHHFKNKSNV